MKCTFDGRLNSQDTILLNLYKRAFPKWSFAPFNGPIPLLPCEEEEVGEEEGMES